MESIIARQKVGKRRSASLSSDKRGSSFILDSRPVKRPAKRREGGYSPLFLDLPGKQPRSLLSQLHGSPGPRFRSINPGLGGLALRLREGIAGFRRPDPLSAERPELRERTIRLPFKHRRAIIAISALASLPALLAIAALIRGPAFPLPPSGLLPAEDSAQNNLLDYVSPELADGGKDADQETLAIPPAPVTLEYSTYTVRSADSLAAIARRFGLVLDTLISANGISNSSTVKTGTELRIPNINGLIYRVQAGDSITAVARRFKTDATKIVDANNLGTARLIKGQSLFIPGARLPESELRQALGQRVAWPARGPLSSYFGYRPDPFTGVRRFHAGIDIVVDAGTPVKAAMDGTVADTGYNGNYGNYVILNHADGFQTLYGHLTQASVSVGTKVSQGSIVGISGNTGYSTGPHLHFGIFRRSLALNPLKYLK